MQKENVNGAIKLLTINMKNGFLPLNNETLKHLKQKHSEASKIDSIDLLPDTPEIVHLIKFENIDFGGSTQGCIEDERWFRAFRAAR